MITDIANAAVIECHTTLPILPMPGMALRRYLPNIIYRRYDIRHAIPLSRRLSQHYFDKRHIHTRALYGTTAILAAIELVIDAAAFIRFMAEMPP